MYAINSNSRQYKTLNTNDISDQQIEIAKSNLPDYLKLYMLFSLSTGAKSEQIRDMKWENIDFENRIVTIDEDILYFNKEVSELLQYERKRRIDKELNDSGYVFRSADEGKYNKDNPISKSTLCNWCTKIGEIIGIPNLRHLDFRHTMIKNMLSASGSVGMTSIISNYPNLTIKSKLYVNDGKNNELIQEYKDICDL